MADFNTLIENSVGYEEFVSQGTAQEIAQLRIDQEKTTRPDFLSQETTADIAALSGKFVILAAAEMWCPDCQRNMPAINALCERYPDAQLAVITRDQSESLFKQQFNLDKVRIPFAAVLDAQLSPLGAFVERPKLLQSGGEEALLAYRRGERLADTLEEIVSIMRQN